MYDSGRSDAENKLIPLIAFAYEHGTIEKFDDVSCKYCTHRDENGDCPMLGWDCMQSTEEAISIIIDHADEVLK